MYEVLLTKNEVAELARVARKYRDNFDDYPGSQMCFTNKSDFTLAADHFLSAIGKSDLPDCPGPQVGAMKRLEIEIYKTSDGQFQIRCGGAFGVLASTAIDYEVSLVADADVRSLLRGITQKFLDQPDINAATAWLMDN